MWAGLGKGYGAKIDEIEAPEVSHRKNSFYSYFRISLSDPYSTSMPNFNLPWKDKLLYILSKYNKRGMGGVSNKQLKKTA